MTTENQTPEVSFEYLAKGFSFEIPEVENKSEDKEFTFELPTEDIPEVKKEEEVKIPKEKDKPLELKVDTSFYTDLIKKKLEKGLWQDADVVDGDKTTKISEFENATEEDYLQFEEDQKAIVEQDLKEK